MNTGTSKFTCYAASEKLKTVKVAASQSFSFTISCHSWLHLGKPLLKKDFSLMKYKYTGFTNTLSGLGLRSSIFFIDVENLRSASKNNML